MNGTGRTEWVVPVAVVLWLALAAAAATPAPQNLAPQARITANSEFSQSFLARFVADGRIAELGGRNDDEIGRAHV